MFKMKGNTDVRIARPSDDYSPLWALYYAQNPHLKRSVGSAGDDNDDNGGGDGGTGEENRGEEGAGNEDKSKGKEPADGGKKNDDKPKVSDREAELLREVMEKKGKIKDLTKELEDFKKKYEGIDPDEVRQIIADRKKAEEEELEKKGEWERLKARMADEHKAEIAKKEQELAAVRSEVDALRKQIEELTVGQSFSNSTFIKDELILTPAKARVVYGAYFEVEDGVVVAYDKPRGASERTKLVNGSGEPLGFEEALRRIVENDQEKDQLLRSKLKPGANSGTKDVKVPVEKPELRGRERIKAVLSAQKVARK